MKPTKNKDVPRFITIPNGTRNTENIDLRVNGKTMATITGMDMARHIMNAVACDLLEKYYPKHHFVISLCREGDVLDTIIL